MKEIKSNTKRRKRRSIYIIISMIAAIIFFLSPISACLRSMIVMGVYNKIQEKDSLLEEYGIELAIPGGSSTTEDDWYPFVMTFNADASYSRYIGEKDARLTILYNFPSFSAANGCSRLFDQDSPYYNSFYGAYLVQDSANEVLKEEKINHARMAAISRFDFFGLVLNEFGLLKEDEVFTLEIMDEAYGVTCAGVDGWTRMQAQLLINGAAHNPRKKVISYLQYGVPGFGKVEEEFDPVAMTVIIYGRYFQEWDIGVYFYVMGVSEDICITCENDIIRQSVINPTDYDTQQDREAYQ